MNMQNITGFVLAGGKSSRMGTNKALLKYRGERLIDIAIAKLEKITKHIVVSSNQPIANINYPVFADTHKAVGPLGGLHKCLSTATNKLNLVIPCDVPEISLKLLNSIINKASCFDAVVPRLPNGKLEPLVAVYSKNILPIVDAQIKLGDYKLVNLLKKAKVKYIDISNPAQLKNINTPNDLA